jgi:TolB protein
MKKLTCYVQLFTFLALACWGFSAQGQSASLGIFTGQEDVGHPLLSGSATYLPDIGQYMITGAGYNIWGDHDEFHYVWKRLRGDFILFARADFVGLKGAEEHRKIGWMVRKSLDGNSPHVNAVFHGDGLTSLQFRRTAGAITEEVKSKLTHANIIQLERRGKTYTMRVAVFGEPFATEQVADIDLGDEVFVGLFVGSHNPDVVETGVFRDVSIVIPAAPDNGPYNMILGSRLELLNVASGERQVLYTDNQSIQAPNWTKDGKSLIYNDNAGRMYLFDLESRSPSVLNTGDVHNNNNDHVISFDGQMLGLSSNSPTLGGSTIYTVPIGGGNPKQITTKVPSYLHGWSPDGKELVFCGSRNGDYDVYRISASGGAEERLTSAKGLDDGPEYSPDGKYIYFNSVRSGLMQIWRMNPDGSGQERVTNDEFNNWFAHISPDGKWIVFLSFLKEETDPSVHPAYRHVYLRLMPAAGGSPKVIAYFYGGQGSMNTPSWSPDGKKVAFISNTGSSKN